MGYSAGIISPPVSVYDVQQPCWVRLKRTVSGQVQTIYSSDVGTLCGASVGDTVPASDGLGSWTVDARGVINKWARYKPERAAGPTPLMHGSIYGQTRTRKTNNFGLEVPFCTLDIMNGKVYNILERTETGWDYLKPRGDMTAQGGVKEFYRLTDFVRIPTDDTDPYYNTVYAKGYNHNAELPFSAFLNMSGVTERSDGVFEINKQGSTLLTVTFYNGRGTDLHLQDFIDLAASYSDNIAWRPVLQIWRDWYAAGGSPWYLRSQPDYQVAGSPITSDSLAQWTVTFDISNFANDPNDIYHLCIGVGCVNPTFTSWKDNNESLFILPYTEQQDEDGELPFYYQFAVVDHFDRQLKFIKMLYYQDSVVDFVGSSVTIPANSIGTVVFQMTINQSSSQALHFVGEHGTPDTGYSSLKICLEDVETHTLHYLTPTQGLNRTQTAVAYVPTGSGTTTIYGMTTQIDVQNIPNGGYGRYQVKAYIGNASPESANAISIHKLATS